MFTSCRPHHPFWLGLCCEDLLFSFAFYLFPHSLFPLKMKLKSPVLRHTHIQASHCMRWLTKQRRAVPRHMKEHKPLVLVLLYLLLILSLHFLTLLARLHLLSCLFSCCKCDERQCDPRFFFSLSYFVLFCFLLHHKRTHFPPFLHLALFNIFKTLLQQFFHIYLTLTFKHLLLSWRNLALRSQTVELVWRAPASPPISFIQHTLCCSHLSCHSSSSFSRLPPLWTGWRECLELCWGKQRQSWAG